MASGHKPAYEVLVKDKVWIDKAMRFATVKYIDENGFMGTRTFSFTDYSERVKVALGDKVVVK